MKISERYSVARSTSNLKSIVTSTLSASDILGAAGMAAQRHSDAMMLWGVVYGSNNDSKMALVESLADKLRSHMTRYRLKGNPRHIAMEVLAHYLHATCTACDGVGYQLIHDTVLRRDEPCDVCGGSGKPHTPAGEAWQWLHQYVATLLSIAAGNTMSKLAGDMDL